MSVRAMPALLVVCTLTQLASAQRVPCTPSKPIATAVQYDPYNYGQNPGFVREQAKGPCKYAAARVAGASWYSSKTLELGMTSEQYQTCLSGTKSRPYVAVSAIVSKASERDSWLVVFGGKGKPASFGSAVGSQIASSAATEVLSEVGEAIVSRAGSLAFFVLDVGKVALDNTCYAKTWAAGKAAIEQLIAVGGRFLYEQRIVPGMASNNRPALVQSAYYRTFIGDPGTGVGEWRVVPLLRERGARQCEVRKQISTARG